MSKEKQIEELAEILRKVCDATPNGKCMSKLCCACRAETVIEAGYRKQGEGEWIENDDGQTVCSHCGETAEVDAWELELRDKVRYSKTTFCPNCGAKMKGGAE